MKQNKGEAAFESIDEVLAGKIVANSKEHGQEKETISSNQTADTLKTMKPANGRSSSKYWIIAAVFAAVILLLGCALFGKCEMRLKKLLR
jgi:hypothetical protein